VTRKKIDELDRLIDICAEHGNLPGLLEILQHREASAYHRQRAVEAIYTRNDDDSWRALEEIARTQDGAAVAHLMALLADDTSSEAAKLLHETLGNPSPFVRMAATRALCRRRTSATFAILLRASRDPEPSIRALAHRTMMRRLDEEPEVLERIRAVTLEGVVEGLDDQRCMRLLADDRPERIRILAARRLGAISSEDAINALAALVEVTQGNLQDTCWRALEMARSVPEYLLLPLVASKDPVRRARGISLYARHVDQNGVGILQAFASDPHPSVRVAAIVNLHRLLGEDSLEIVKAATDDEDETVRLKAVDLLTRIEAAAPELLEIVERHTGEPRRLALISLANRGVCSPSLVMPYMEFILQGSSVTDVTQKKYLDGLSAAAKVLARENSPEALLALTSMARSVIKRLRRIAIEAIMLFDAADRADALHSLIDTYDQDILKNIAFGLHEIDDPRAAIPLIRAAYECKGRAVLRAREAIARRADCQSLDFLISCLSARWPTVRRFGAERLKLLRNADAVPALLTASRDEDVEVQLAVFEALGCFAATVPEVTARLIEALGYGDISVRQAAAEALGEAGCREAVPELIRSLHNFFLRPRVTEALRRIGDRKGYLAIRRLERREALFKSRKKVLHVDRRRKARAASA
jgi:HEAT repeat protein